MPSKLRKGKVSRSELLLQLVPIYAGVSLYMISKGVKINYGWLYGLQCI